MSIELQELLERLAELHHNQWRTWAAGLTLSDDERLSYAKAMVPYSKLSEDLKNARRGVAQLQLEAAEQVFGDIDGRAQKLYAAVLEVCNRIPLLYHPVSEGKLPFEQAADMLAALGKEWQAIDARQEMLAAKLYGYEKLLAAVKAWHKRDLTDRVAISAAEDALTYEVDTLLQAKD